MQYKNKINSRKQRPFKAMYLFNRKVPTRMRIKYFKINARFSWLHSWFKRGKFLSKRRGSWFEKGNLKEFENNRELIKIRNKSAASD